MKFINDNVPCGTNCCDPCGTVELEGCANGVPYAQLVSISTGSATTRWINLDTGDVVTTKPAGFLTGACSAAENSLAFSAASPTATSPFATPKDNYTTFVTSDGTSAGTITEMWKYDLETATWVQVPLGAAAADLISTDANNALIAGTDGKLFVPEQVTTTMTDVVATGHLIGTYTNEAGAAVAINETVTAVTGTLATGHAIGTYTNESGTAVTLNETITSVSEFDFDAATGFLTLSYVDEVGATNTSQISIPVGDKYKTSSTTCQDIVSTGQLTFTIGTGLAYTALQDIIAYAADGHHMNGHVVSYDAATGVLVMDVDQKTGSGNYCSWVFNLDAVQAAATVETTTTLTNTVTGHKIGTYTNEVNAAVDINETVTALSITGSDLSFVDETGTSNTVSLAAAIASGVAGAQTVTTITGALATGHTIGTYNNEAGTAVVLKETVTALSISGTNLSYVDENGTTNTVALASAIASGVASSQTVTTVTGALATGHAIGTYNNEAGTAVVLNETVTTMTNVLTSGTKIGTYTNENGVAVDIYAPAASGSSALWTTVTTNPAATGNTGGPFFTYNSVTGDKYYVDSAGVAYVIESGTGTCNTVFFNSTDPSTATIFDTANPPVTNNNALKNLDCAIYVGTDGSIWSSNGTTYATKTYSFPTQQLDTDTTATAGQTAFTLSKTPIGKVWIYRNGIRLPAAAISWVGTAVTYIPANNGGKTMDANDRVEFEYEAY